jgi:branched-subunit amino acid ABC-type transport system permease component
MELLPQVIITGLAVGGTYALAAVGVSLVFGVLNIVNFGHGAAFAVGAYLALVLLKALGMNIVLAFAIATGGAYLIGWVIERTAVRPLRDAPLLMPLITTLGLGIFLENLIQFIFGPETQPFPTRVSHEPFHFAGATVSLWELITMLVTVVSIGALHVFLHRTSFGTAVRAIAEDRRTAALLGINVDRLILVTFCISSALGGLAGILGAALYNAVHPTMGSAAMLKAFAASVLGGMEVMSGAILGGLLLGVAESLGSVYISSAGATGSLMALVVVLLFKPTWPPRPPPAGEGRAAKPQRSAAAADPEARLPPTGAVADSRGCAGTAAPRHRRVCAPHHDRDAVVCDARAQPEPRRGLRRDHLDRARRVLRRRRLRLGAPRHARRAAGVAGFRRRDRDHRPLRRAIRLAGDAPARPLCRHGHARARRRHLRRDAQLDRPDARPDGHPRDPAAVPLRGRDRRRRLLLPDPRDPDRVGGGGDPHDGVGFRTRGAGDARRRARRGERRRQARKLKMVAFGVAAAIAGACGSFWAHFVSFISPDSFNIMESIGILAMVVLGGLGSIPGAIVGGAILAGLPELLRFASDYRQAVYGLAMMLVVLYRPQGLLGFSPKRFAAAAERRSPTSLGIAGAER